MREQEQARIKEQARVRKEAEEAAKFAAEQAQLEAAQKLFDQGKEDAAAELVQQEVIVAPIKKAQTYVPPVAKVQGVSVKTTYRAEVINFQVLLQAVADGKVSVHALIPDMVFLNNAAREAKDTDKLGYPGVVVVSSDSVASGRG